MLRHISAHVGAVSRAFKVSGGWNGGSGALGGRVNRSAQPFTSTTGTPNTVPLRNCFNSQSGTFVGGVFVSLMVHACQAGSAKCGPKSFGPKFFFHLHRVFWPHIPCFLDSNPALFGPKFCASRSQIVFLPPVALKRMFSSGESLLF